MDQWQIDFEKGKVFLARHKPGQAWYALARSWKYCPTCDCRVSSDILYYMGISLKKLGYCSCAVRLWISANRIWRQRRIQKLIERYANGYGMLRQPTKDLDDRNAFFSIHIGRYLEKKHNHQFSTLAEQDVIFELTQDYWNHLQRKKILQGKSIEEKRELFHKILIPYPYMLMPKCFGDSIVHVNFCNNANKTSPNMCFCGSGLPFAMCCGRTNSFDEYI